MHQHADPASSRQPAASGGRRRAPGSVEWLQRAVGNRGVARVVGTRQLQRRHIDQTLPALVLGGPSGHSTQLNLQAGRGVTKIDYQMRRWHVQLPAAADRRAAIQAEQAWLATNGNAIGGQNGQLVANTIVVPRAPRVPEEIIGGNQYATQLANQHWPFVVRLLSTYGPANVAREVDVNFAQDKYGYITRIIDGAQRFEMQVPPEFFGVMFFEEHRDYSSFHEVDAAGGRNIRTQAEAMANSRDADDQTKVIAEGARWQAVRDHAAAGRLTDQSRFYPAANTAAPWQPDDMVPYVTLADLFTQWNKFGRGWDINNQTLRTKLLEVASLRSGQAQFSSLGAADYAA